MEAYEGLRDEELIGRLRLGEKEIMDHLLEKYKDLVKKKARALFLMGGETDDLIQEGMIGLFKAIRDYRPDRDTSFRTFAGLCIDRQLATAVEASTRKKHQVLNTAVSLSGGPEEKELDLPVSASPEDLVIDRENRMAAMGELLRTLSPLEKQVLKLHQEGKSYAAIAMAIGRKPKSVENALQRIRGKMRHITG